MIYMVYTPNERSIVEDIVANLPQQYEYGFAPAGIQAGSDEWQAQVQTDIESCDFVVLLITRRGFKDETVRWRLELALERNKKILPVIYSSQAEHSVIMDMAQEEYQVLVGYQMLTLFENMVAGVWNYSEDRLRSIGQVDDKQFKRLAAMIETHVRPTLACFISYSRRDTDFATKLAQDLRQQGIKTWRDAENIPAGANWDREIEQAIRDCTHMLLLASQAAVQSENVLDEIGLALNKEKAVIPLMIETCELPLRVHRAQWIDFRDNYDMGLDKLFEQLGQNKQPKTD